MEAGEVVVTRADGKRPFSCALHAGGGRQPVPLRFFRRLRAHVHLLAAPGASISGTVWAGRSWTASTCISMCARIPPGRGAVHGARDLVGEASPKACLRAREYASWRRATTTGFDEQARVRPEVLVESCAMSEAGSRTSWSSCAASGSHERARHHAHVGAGENHRRYGAGAQAWAETTYAKRLAFDCAKGAHDDERAAGGAGRAAGGDEDGAAARRPKVSHRVARHPATAEAAVCAGRPRGAYGGACRGGRA